MEITIKIQAPELAHAIETLAIAIGCTVDKIGVGEAIKEAVNQGPAQDPEPISGKVEKAPEMVEDDDPPSDVPVTLEQVREAFVAKNSKTNAPKLKAILKEFSVAKVTDLPEEHFAAVLKRLEAI